MKSKAVSRRTKGRYFQPASTFFMHVNDLWQILKPFCSLIRQ